MAEKTKAKKKAAVKRVKNIKPEKKAAKKKAAGKRTAKTKKQKKKAVKARLKVNSGSKKKPVGAPEKYDKAFDGRAERYIARYGMNLSEMAKEFGVSKALVYRWMKECSSFADAVEAGRKLMSSEIEHNLRRVAVPHDEVTDEYETTSYTDDKTGDVVGSRTEGKHKIKRGVVNVNAALRLLQAGDARFRPNIKLDANEAIDGLSKLLKEIDGDHEGLPTGS